MERITIVSTGGDGSGMHKVTGDITQMAAQIPALFETLSGMQMKELFSKVRPIGDKSGESGSRRQRRLTWHYERVATLCFAPI